MAAKKPQPPPISQKIWRVYYEGLWLGGVAIVVAPTQTKAIELVQNDHRTENFRHCDVELVANDINVPAVVYNDNGNY